MTKVVEIPLVTFAETLQLRRIGARRTGRTTMMLKAAVHLANQGKDVIVVGRNHHFATFMLDFIKECGLVSRASLTVFSGTTRIVLSQMRGRRPDVIFEDHDVQLDDNAVCLKFEGPMCGVQYEQLLRSRL